MNNQQKQRALDIVLEVLRKMMDDGDDSFTIWFDIEKDGKLTLTIDSLNLQTTVELKKEE